MKKPGRPPFDDVLTPAEWRVCESVRHGLTNPQIARRLHISVDAVKYHVANALQKLGLASRKELRLWAGVRKSSPLHEARKDMNGETRINAIGQIARSVRDIESAEAFYRDKLGLKHLYTFGNLSFFDCDGTRLFLTESESETQESILYFRVGDIHASAAALMQRGVEFVNAPHLIHRHADGVEEWMAFFNDNEGRTLALMTQIGPKSAAS